MKSPLTKALLNNPPSIPSGKGKLLIFDNKINGFMVEVRPSCITFYLKWKDRRSQIKSLKLGRYGSDISLEQARKRAGELRSVIALGGDPHADRQAEKAALSVAEFVEQRFLPHQRARKRSWDEDRKILQKRVLPNWGPKMLSAVTTADVQKLHEGVLAEGRTPATANRHLCVVKRMFNLAPLWGDVAKDPAKPVKLYPENNERQRFLTQSEIPGLLTDLDADPDVVGASAIKLLILTGARANEALSARWEHVDLERRLWTLPNPKGGRVVHKPLSGAAVSLLVSQPRVPDNPHVFPGERAGDHRHDLRWTWARVCQVAGIENCRLHDVRDSFASLLVSKNVSIFVVQKLLNHSTPQMTMRYAHLAPNQLLDASEVAARALAKPGPVIDPE